MLTRKEKLSKARRRLRLMFRGKPGQAMPAFVFGEMRSGTNMVIRTLAKSRDTECYYETDDEAFKRFRIRDKDQVSQLIKRSRAKLVVFKPIADSQNAVALLDAHKSSRAIWIFRRYQDAVTSAMVRWHEHAKYLHYILHEPEIADWRREGLSSEKLDLIQHYYDQNISDATARALIWYLRNSLYFDQNLDNDDRVLLVNYEQITSEPTTEFRKITAFLGCAYHDAIIRDIHSRSAGKTPTVDIDDSVRALCDSLYAALTKALRNQII